MLRILSLVFLLSNLVACDGDNEVYEELKKLRGIGVEISPLIPKPEENVTLTVYAVVPKDDKIETVVYDDEENALSPNIKSLTLDKASPKYDTKYSALDIYSVSATFKVPSKEELQLDARGGAVNLRYAFRLTSGVEEEQIVGKVAVLDPDSADGKKTWAQPDFTIEKPTTDIAKDSDVDISAKIKNKNDEDMKIGWFVSHGKIKSRRARSTTWESGGANKQLLIGTVRGKRSHSFKMDIKEYTAK